MTGESVVWGMGRDHPGPSLGSSSAANARQGCVLPGGARLNLVDNNKGMGGEVKVLTRLDPGGGRRKSGYLMGGEGSLEATSGWLQVGQVLVKA